jgi:hypothetical protein
MVDWHRKFRREYDAARTALASGGGFERGWQALAERLAALMGLDGFDVGREESLGELRRRVADHAGEDKELLNAAGGATEPDAGAVDADAAKRAAALKLLRHVYLQNRAGNRRAWVVSLPVEFRDWPSRQLAASAGSSSQVRQLLASRREHFDEQQRTWLGIATQQGLAWCQKAGIVLAAAGMPAGGAGASTLAGRAQARAMVRRWFAEEAAPERAIDALVGTLARGFKDIVATLNRGHFVITDWVPFRGASTADESDFLASEAFTFRGGGEGMDVVYVEGAFFDEVAGSILRGPANWARILVHELSHLVCGTHDLTVGLPRYAWNGIGPHAGYAHGETIRNADNWAFFAADCGAALTPGQRETALRRA